MRPRARPRASPFALARRRRPRSRPAACFESRVPCATASTAAATAAGCSAQRDWNVASLRFNAIQPVSGPFLIRVVAWARLSVRRQRGRGLPVPVSDSRSIALIRVGPSRTIAKRHASVRAASAGKEHGFGAPRRRATEPAMMRRRAPRGIALFAALALMAVIALLVAGARRRRGRVNARHVSRARTRR